jgi:putative uncharacterized protein (fragment)
MSTDLTLFTHPVFGNLRTIVDGETIYICAKDAATALGYSNTNDAIKLHCKGVVKRYPHLSCAICISAYKTWRCS